VRSLRQAAFPLGVSGRERRREKRIEKESTSRKCRLSLQQKSVEREIFGGIKTF